MSLLDLHDTQPEFAVERHPDGDVQLRLRAGGFDMHITIGRLYDDVSLFAQSLHHLAEDIDQDIFDGWRDTPDESDAYITVDHSRYHVSLDSARVGNYPSRAVAEIELARARVNTGVFPNAWLITDHSNPEPINDDTRRWHNEAGDQLAPIPSVQYRAGDPPPQVLPDVTTDDAYCLRVEPVDIVCPAGQPGTTLDHSRLLDQTSTQPPSADLFSHLPGDPYAECRSCRAYNSGQRDEPCPYGGRYTVFCPTCDRRCPIEPTAAPTIPAWGTR